MSKESFERTPEQWNAEISRFQSDIKANEKAIKQHGIDMSIEEQVTLAKDVLHEEALKEEKKRLKS